MSSRRYSGISSDGSKAKPILIAAAGVAVIIIGVLVYLAVKAGEDNRVAALKYRFNRYYPGTYNTVEEVDGAADYDKDGFTNGDEESGKTSMIAADSDKDGIIDSLESKYETDPMITDCDGDGIPDGIELLAGLDPMSLITDGNTKDSERTFTRVIDFAEGSVTITGKANIYGATVEALSLNAVSANAGALTAPYELYCDGGFDSARIKLRYDSSAAALAGQTEADIQIYQFDPYLKSYNAIGGVADPSDASVACDLSGNGVFVLGANKVIHQAAEAYVSGQMNVHLIIDNSGSMYPSSSDFHSEENDVNFKRLAFAQKFVTALGNNVKFAISTFTYDIKPIIGFDADKSHVVQAINSIKQLGAGFDGTSVENAMMHGLESFGPETISERNIVILLTDGISTDTAGYTVGDIVALSKAKNVTVMTISLGNSYDRELLENLAHRTGGEYYPIAEAKVLEGLYSTMIASMDDDIVDDDFDGTPDCYTLYDTGFNPDFNGYSFNNFKSKTSGTLDFGMAMLARDWFRTSVPDHAGSTSEENSYTFEGTTISLTDPLRKVVLQSMQTSWLKPDNYLDFFSTGYVLKVKREIKKEAEEKGWTTVTIPYDEPGTGWTQAEVLVPDHTSSTLRTAYSENDYAMMRAIHYYNALRDTGENFVLNSEADLNKVKSVLATGTPIVTKLLWEENGECHSRYVLMITLRRDLENPNVFKMKIYDVNTESANTVVLNRTLKTTGGSGNDFTYTGSWSNKAVSITCYLTETPAK